MSRIRKKFHIFDKWVVNCYYKQMMNQKIFVASTIVAALLIIALILYFFFIKQPASSQESMEGGPGSTEPVSTPAGFPGEEHREKIIGEKEPTQLPMPDIRLNTSDEPVRELVTDCSTHPDFAQWLKNKNILRRSVAIVDNISNGASPAPHLQFLLPSDQFKVIERNGKIILDQSSYIRYQPITMVLVSLDSEKLVRVYRQLAPVIEEAYSELGYPGTKFQETLEETIDVLLKTPIPEGEILLEEKVTTYAFADPNLEALNDAQKQFLRMGPQNVRKIQAKLREIKEALKRQ
jgi:hypothetical protein